MKNWIHKNQWAILIFGMALVIRLWYLAQIKSNPFFASPIVDELWNLQWAKSILETSFWGTEVYFRGPLYPYFLALILKITGSDYFWARFTHIIISSGSVVLTYLLAREYFSEKVARLASVFHALYGMLIFYESMFLIPVVFIFLNLLGLLAFVRNKDNPRKSTFYTIGLIFGLSAIARPNVLVVVALLGLWLYYNLRGKIEVKTIITVIVLFFVGTASAVLPVTIRNYVVADDVVLISSQGGINLYLGNNPNAEGLTMRMPEITLDSKIPWDKFIPTVTDYAEKQSGHPLKPSEESSYWTNKAKQFMFEHPGQFLGLTFRKLIYFFSGFENSDQLDIYDFRQYSSLFSFLVFDYGLKFPFGLFAPLGLLGLYFGLKRRRELAPLYIFIIAYIPTVVLFLVTARHRLTIVPLLLIFAAFAIVHLWDEFLHRRRLFLPLFAFLVLVSITNINWFDIGFQNKAQIHHNLAINYSRTGEYQKAIEEYTLAITETPGVPALYFGLGTAYYNLARYAEAEQQLSHAVAIDPEFTDALMNLGMTYSSLGDHARASRMFRRVTDLEPDRAAAFAELGNELMALEEPADASAMLKKAVDMRPEDFVSLTKLGVLFGQAGDTSTASKYFAEALDINEDYLAGYVNWGNIVLRAGDTLQAVERYQAAMGVDSTAIEPYYNLAVLYIKMGDRARALHYIQTILRMHPGFEPALALQKRLES